MKTIQEALTKGASFLTESETPFLDSSLLLASVMNIPKEKLFASYPDPVTGEQYIRYRELIDRRKKNIPIAYLLNRKEFYGLPFFVDERVLIPRPDTETLIETALSLLNKQPNLTRILDLCCGSGCIGITLKHEVPECLVTCSDVSEDVLDVCRLNSKKLLGEVLPAVKSDLFETISGKFDIIISNPPYLTKEEVHRMTMDGWPEPELALKGGKDGLRFIRKIITEAGTYLSPGGYILLESAIDQTYYIKQELTAAGFTETTVVQDLTGRNRVTLGRKQKQEPHAE